MALIETLTIVNNTGAAGETYAYSPLGVPSPVTVRPNVPEVWFVHKCYEKITGGSPSNTVVATNTTATITGTGITFTIPPRVGDYMTWGGGDIRRLGVITTINPAAAGSISVVLTATDSGFGSAGTTTNTQLWISYQNRRSRLGSFHIEASNPNGVLTPVPFGQPYLARTTGTELIEDGDVATAYYVDASRFAQSLYSGLPLTQPRLTIANIRFVWSLASGDSPVEFSYANVRNCTEYTPAMRSYQVNGVLFDVRFNINNVEVKAGTPSLLNNAIPFGEFGPWVLPATGPVTCFPSHAGTKWVQFQSRYGTPMVLPFNYALDETLETNLIGTARKGYDTRNVNMQGYDSLELSTGMVSNRFREWYEDLATSPYVYVADSLPNGLFENSDGSTPAPSGPVVLYNDPAWIEYRIEAGSITTKANANDLMALSFTVVKCRQRVTYNA